MSTPGHFNGNQGIFTKQFLPSFTWNTSQQTPKDILRQNVCENIKRKGQELPSFDTSRVRGRKRIKKLKDGEITEEILKRREKNRNAAKKCRLKKSNRVETLTERVNKYENCNKHLEKEIQKFKEEKRKLENLLDGHNCRQQHQKPIFHRHFEQHSVNNKFKHCATKTKDVSSVAAVVTVPQLQSNSLKVPFFDESKKHSIELFLNDLHDDDLWDGKHCP